MYVKKLKILKIGLVIGIILFCTSLKPQYTYKQLVKVVVIDAGHGGKDPGCLGGSSLEKHLALDIALKTGELFQKYLPEVEVIYTRDKDEFVSLKKRVQLANRLQASIFVSIHCNSYPYSSMSGTETYTLGLSNNRVSRRENSAIFSEQNYKNIYKNFDPFSSLNQILTQNFESVHRQQSILLASEIENQFKHRMKRKSRGVRQSKFLVLSRTNMPSVLVEVGYLTNKNEERYLKSEYGQLRVAASIYRGIRNYKHKLEHNIN